MNSNFTGIVLALAGGVLVGNCMLPLKKIRIWPWECTWLVFSFVSLLVVPCLIASLTIPGWPRIYASMQFTGLLPSLFLGFGWGIAQVLFGISVVRLGMALAFTIIVGLGTVFGTLVPLVVLQKSELASGNSQMLITGCGLMIAGVVLSGYAGKLREHPHQETGNAYLSGLGIAVLSGVLSSMLNLSLAFGMPIALAGGLIPNLGYTAYLLYKNRSWGKLMYSVRDAFLSLLMGSLWIGAVAIYGLSTRYLGRLG